MPDDQTPARQTVEVEIRENGPITFARFMEIALYGEHGYYTKSPNPSSDYFTSPQMHPAFGALIAGWLFKTWKALGRPTVFDVVEIGAGDGGLARDVLDTLKGSDECDRFANVLRYRAYDLQPREAVLGTDELSQIEPIVGCVVNNELLDAFPCHVFAIRNGAVLESYVGLDDDGELAFVDGEVSAVEIEDRIGPLASLLPDGYRGEVNLGIDGWASIVAQILRRGYVLTIDYGYERGALYHPDRPEGSLRCYRDHVLSQNPFRHVGLQDITAHVDFMAVDEALNRVGIEPMSELKSQRDFLFDLGIDRYLRQVRETLVSGRYTNDERDWVRELRALNALIDTRGLGYFRVAQHRRRAPRIDLSELETASIFRLLA